MRSLEPRPIFENAAREFTVAYLALTWPEHVRAESLMAGSKIGESKWITAGKLMELLSHLQPDTMVAANDHYNLSLYEPGGLPEKYIGVIDIRREVIVPK